MRLFLIAIVATMALAATSFGGAVKVGEAMESRGRVEVVKPDAVRGTPLRAGGIIEEGDIVRTASGASAIIMLVDGSVLDVGASSRVKFYDLSPQSDKHVDLEKGDVLFEITPITPIRGTFKIKTTTSIIGVKGTNFRVLTTPSSTKITMNRGEIALSSIASPGKKVSVSAGQIAVVTSSGIQTRRQTSSEQSGSFTDLQSTNAIEGSISKNSGAGIGVGTTVGQDVPAPAPAPSPSPSPSVDTPSIATPDVSTPDITPVTPPAPVNPDDKRPVKPDPVTPPAPAPSGAPAVKIIVK